MLGHLGINVPDLVAAKQYYDRLMPHLGFEEFLSAADEFAYRPANGKRGTYLFVYGATEVSDYSRHRTGLQHLAFIVPTRSAVDDVEADIDAPDSWLCTLVAVARHWCMIVPSRPLVTRLFASGSSSGRPGTRAPYASS